MITSRESILTIPDPVGTFETVHVPEWGDDVTVRPMTGARRDRFEQACLKDPGNNVRARVAAYSICDPAGRFLFDEADIPLLGDQPASALDRIFHVALRLSAIGPKDVDALEKN